MGFTVILLRPDYMNEATEARYGQDIYVALVSAEEKMEAVRLARLDVFAADKKDGLKPKGLNDYVLCCLLDGHCNVGMFGWQV